MYRTALIIAALGLGACSTASPYGGTSYNQGPSQGPSARNINCGAGVLGGAVIGGLAGNQFGKGSGKDVATAAGAGLGAAIGATRPECQPNAYRQPQGYGQTHTPVLVGYDQYGRPVYR